MNIGGLFTVLIAFFQFPAELTAFVKLLQETPDEKKADIIVAVAAQLQSFEQTGRPS